MSIRESYRYGIGGMLTKEFVSDIDITLPDGSKIRETIEGYSCSHSNFKMVCRKCMEHYSKDFSLRVAFYEINKHYLECLA